MSTAKEKIKKAFLQLYEERPIEKISVRLLTEAAGVNRGTFYDHYLDIYDLRDQIEEEFTDNVTDMVRHLAAGIVDDDMSYVIEHFDDFYTANHTMIEIYLIKRPSVRLQTSLKNLAKANVCRFLGLDYDNLDDRQQLIMEYIAGGQIAIAACWFGQNVTHDIAGFTSLIRSINTRGALTCLMSS
jgi:AcrR family transcriptional regulator